MTLYTPIIICSTLLGFCLSLIVIGLVQKAGKQSTPSVDRRLRRLHRKLDSALDDDMNASRAKTFQRSLQDASLTTEFQLPSLRRQVRKHQPPPEKYTILRKLISQGMSNEEIASILNISLVEVSQLVKLNAVTETKYVSGPEINHG